MTVLLRPKFAAYFQNTFSLEHLWRAAYGFFQQMEINASAFKVKLWLIRNAQRLNVEDEHWLDCAIVRLCYVWLWIYQSLWEQLPSYAICEQLLPFTHYLPLHIHVQKPLKLWSFITRPPRFCHLIWLKIECFIKKNFRKEHENRYLLRNENF